MQNAPVVVCPVRNEGVPAGATPRVQATAHDRFPHGATMMDAIRAMEYGWRSDERWAGTLRPYRAEGVERLRGSVRIQHTLAELGAARLRRHLDSGSRGGARG